MIRGGGFLVDSIKLEDTFIPEEMNVDQKLLGKIIEEYLRGEVEPFIKELETKKEGLMLALLKNGARVGLNSVDIPNPFGGMGLDRVSSMIVTEKCCIGGPFAIAHLASTTFGTLPIIKFGTAAQQSKYLPDLANGKKIGAFALTEPDAGSDALGGKTIAVLSEDEKYYVLNGEKQFTSNAGYADLFITFAKVDGEKLTAFIIARDSEGLSFGEEEDKMGIRGTSTRSLIFDNVKVPLENLLFELGKGQTVAVHTLNIGRHKLGGLCVGLAKIAFNDAIRYGKNRIQFGQTISNYGLIKEKIAEMAIRIFVSESMVYRTSKLLEDADGVEEEYAIECSVNKVYASEMLDYVVDEALQIHGGYGYIKDYSIEQYYRDSRIFRIFGGTNEVNRLLIFRVLLGKIRKGYLSLSDLVGKAPSCNDLQGPTHLLNNAKKVTCSSLRMVCEAYPEGLEDHQELMGMISNMIIELFAMESCLLRTQKIVKNLGEEKGEVSQAISQIYTVDAFMRLERWAKIILGAIAEGEILQTQLSALGKLTQFAPFDLIALQRKIADFMVKNGRYFIL